MLAETRFGSWSPHVVEIPANLTGEFTWTSRACSATTPSPCSTHVSKGIPKEDLHLPGPDFVDRVWAGTDRSPQVLRNLAAALRPRPPRRHRLRVDPPGRPGHRALGGARRSRPNPKYFDPQNIVELAIEGGCNAVATTFGVLGSVARARTRTRSRSS